MNILIIGFTDYNELDKTMNNLIEQSQCYLFNVICGGLSRNGETISEQWAIKNGAPIRYIFNEDMDKLLWLLKKETDYIVIKIDKQTPQIWKNFMMTLKAEGKHGTVVRGE